MIMKQLSRWKIGIIAGIILVIALAVWIYSSNANSLAVLHQDEFQAALGRHYGYFGGKLNDLYVISYQLECSIIEARYTGLSLGTNYYLLKNNGSGWEVTNWAPAADPVTDDLVDKRLPNPFTCAGE